MLDDVRHPAVAPDMASKTTALSHMTKTKLSKLLEDVARFKVNLEIELVLRISEGTGTTGTGIHLL